MVGPRVDEEEEADFDAEGDEEDGGELVIPARLRARGLGGLLGAPRLRSSAPAASCGACRSEQVHLAIAGEGESGKPADGFEAQAVERGGAEFFEGGVMFGRGIAFVRGEAVLGEDGVPGAHAGVAVDLGDDGGGGDGVAAGVAFDEGALGDGEIDGDSVDEDEIGRGGEAEDGGAHGRRGTPDKC